MLKSTMLVFNLNSLLVLLLAWMWLTILCSKFTSEFVVHLSNRFCNTITDDGSFNNWIQDCRKVLIRLTWFLGWTSLVWSNEDSISYIGMSWLGYTVYVDTTFCLRNYFMASFKVSFSFPASNCLGGSIFFLIHWCCTGSCLAASSIVLAPPHVTMLMFLPSSLASVEIHYMFWLFCFCFSCIFPKSVVQSSIFWSVARQYMHVAGGSGHSLA